MYCGFEDYPENFIMTNFKSHLFERLGILLFFIFFPAFTFASGDSHIKGQSDEIPLTLLNIEIEFDTDLFSKDSANREQICKEWLKAFAPDTGPWGFGLAKSGRCFFEKSAGSEVRMQHFNDIVLFVKRNPNPSSSLEFKLCRPRLNKNELSQIYVPEQLRCYRPISISTTFQPDSLLSDPDFTKWIAAQILEDFPFFSYRSDERKEPVKKDKELSVEVLLPPEPLSQKIIHIFYSTELAKFNVRFEDEKALKTTNGNRWIVIARIPTEREAAYQKVLQQIFAKQKMAISPTMKLEPSHKANLPIDLQSPADERSEIAKPMNWDLELSAVLGLPLNSLASEYRASLKTRYFNYPRMFLGLGYLDRNSNYRLQIPQSVLNPLNSNDSYLIRSQHNSLQFTPLSVVLSHTSRFIDALFLGSMSYTADFRRTFLRAVEPDAVEIQTEKRTHHIVEVQPELNLGIADGFAIVLLGQWSRDVKDKTSDVGSRFGLCWMENPSKGTFGFRFGVYFGYDSSQRSFKMNNSDLSPYVNAISNSLNYGLSFAVAN